MVVIHAQPKDYFMKKARKVVLVTGAQGVIGRAAAEHFSKEAEATVYGVSRRPVVGLENVQPISADLMNPEDTRKKLGVLKDVTHVVFGAYVEKETPTERSVANVALLRNLMDTVEESAPNLRHVTTYQGGKAYGADLGPFKTPAREDDPRLMSPNFYYDQEDHLMNGAQEGANLGTNFRRMGLQGEMSRVVKDHLRGRIVPAVSLGSGRKEERIVLSPDRERRRAVRAEVFLELRVERHVVFVISEQIELNLGTLRPIQ